MTETDILTVVTRGVLLGLGAAAPIGPVNIEIARRSLRRGFRAGFLLGCGAVTVDVIYVILTSFGVRPFIGQPRVRLVLGIAGAVALAGLGGMCFLRAARQWRAGLDLDDARPGGRDYVTGLAMTGLNPMTLAFWCVVVPGLVGQWSVNPVRDLPWVGLGVFLGALAWVVFFAGTLAWVGRRGTRTAWVAADLIGGAMLLAFGSYALWRVASA